MSESLVLTLIFSIWFLLNLCGIGLFHYQWKREHKPGEWKTDLTFGLFTGLMFVFGVCYLGISAFVAGKSIVDNLKK